jgi:adenylyltransferase/sulfurtransferase
LREDTSIEWFDGDIVWDLGTGAYRDVDIVFGCLDNVETRIAANKQCWLADTPWIDAGISKLAAHVKVYQPPSPPCYQCTASRQQLMAARQRYSCDNFKKKYYSSGKVPTVQIASAFVAAVQAQEGVKLLCGQEPTEKKIHYQGKNNDFFLMGQRPDSECPVCSLSYPEITKLELDQHVTLRSFLNKISQKEFSGAGATLDFRGDRTFVVSACCRSCERPIELMRPSFRIYDADVICNFCRGGGRQVDQLSEEVETEKELLYQFSLDQTDSEILNLTLGQIGVPSSHILTVRSKNGCEKHYEIGGTPASGRV